jgi:aminopeptidase N
VKLFSFRKIRSLAHICLTLAAAIQIYGQQTSFDRPRVYDVKNYIIRVSFDRSKKVVFGDTTVELTPLNSELSTIDLDAAGLNFTSVQLEGAAKNLQYTAGNGSVNVALDHAYKPGEAISIRFKYTIKDPKKGIYFIAASEPKDKFRHPAQIWSQNEPEDARYWFPSFDFPSDKATSEEFITAPKGDVAVGNGRFLGTKSNPDGTTTFHFRMEVPHSTYLTSFVVGDFAKLTDKHLDVPLGFYAYKDRQRVAGTAFARTKDMMANYEALTGIPFPFAKYDQIMVSGFQEFDGMENVTATTLADSNILFAELPLGRPLVEDLISHELAHSWFGDMVTCRNWSELWLNEGFATFMEAVTRENFYGREAYLLKLAEDRDAFIVDEAMSKKRHALRNERAVGDNSLFDVTTYQKGGLVLHMLRETVGDVNFWKGVNLYLNQHKFDNVTSSDLQKAMEQTSGQDLQWFFDQWVFAAGYPKLEVHQAYDAGSHQVKVTVDQVQKDDGMTPLAYRLPLEVTFTTPNGQVNQVLNVTKRSDMFSVDVPAEPTKLEVDKNEKVMLKTVKFK